MEYCRLAASAVAAIRRCICWHPASCDRSSQRRQWGDLAIRFRSVECSMNAGDVLHGWVEMSVEYAIQISEILISFYGEICYSDNNQLHFKRFDHVTKSLTKAVEEGSILKPGEYRYDFYVGSGHHLPSSAQGARGSLLRSVQYYCQVEVVETTSNGAIPIVHKQRRVVQVRNDAISRPLKAHSIGGRAALHFCNWFDISGPVLVNLSLSKKRFRRGDKVLFNAEVINCYRNLEIFAGIRCSAEGLLPVSVHLILVKIGQLKSSDSFHSWHGQSIWIPDASLMPAGIQTAATEISNSFVLIVKPYLKCEFLVEVPIELVDDVNMATGEKSTPGFRCNTL